MWTDWSPCSVTCGQVSPLTQPQDSSAKLQTEIVLQGYRLRTRVYTVPFVPNRVCDNARLTQKQDCRMVCKEKSETVRSSGKQSKTVGNSSKKSETVGNSKKLSETVGNRREQSGTVVFIREQCPPLPPQATCWNSDYYSGHDDTMTSSDPRTQAQPRQGFCVMEPAPGVCKSSSIQQVRASSSSWSS